jgi:hypothetical protein
MQTPIGIFIEADQRWKQLQAEHQQLSHLAPTPSITTIQQLGLCIVHAISTLQVLQKACPFTGLPAFDHYDFRLPRDQIIGLF